MGKLLGRYSLLFGCLSAPEARTCRLRPRGCHPCPPCGNSSHLVHLPQRNRSFSFSRQLVRAYGGCPQGRTPTRCEGDARNHAKQQGRRCLDRQGTYPAARAALRERMPWVCALSAKTNGQSRSGRLFLVASRAVSCRHFSIAAWLPPSRISGTFQPLYSAGRV